MRNLIGRLVGWLMGLEPRRPATRRYLCDGSMPMRRAPRRLCRSSRFSPATSPGIALVVLAGCGGGGEAPAPACVPQQNITVSLLGNSIMAAIGDEPALRIALFAQFGAGVTVTNRAVGGTELADIVIGRAGFRPWPQDAGDVTVILDGTNEARRGSSLAQFAADLKTVTARPGVVLVTPPPMDQTQPLSNGADVLPFVLAMRVYPVADLYAYTSAMTNWQASFPDGVHPGPAFAAQIAREVVAPAVGREVSRLRCN